ncbi:uncharacterized protein VTP21DRAFT_3291 [Calcarisporiella thermophila]|uniref:uncharacterized protein n=1 Tax=Calcarisporiella thermophila TaxID=911321 RepID=UPI00374374D7
MEVNEPEHETIFHQFIYQAGGRLGSGGSSTRLVVDPAIFRRNLTKKLVSHTQHDGVAQFLEALQEHLDHIENLRSCLIPMTLEVGASNRFNSTTPDSLVRLLLSIDCLQPELMDQLLERLPNFIMESEENSDAHSSSLHRMILQQFRWLDYVVEPRRLTEKLLEIIDCTPFAIQRDIIVNLPEILNDSEHKTVAHELKKIMEENQELLVPILDALGNLSLPPDFMSDVRSIIIDRLRSADLDSLPVVIKVLLQTCTPENAQEVVRRMRNAFDINSISQIQQETSLRFVSQLTQRRKMKPDQVPEALILDAIKTGVRFHKFVYDAWFRVISENNRPDSLKSLDVLVLFILHVVTNNKRKIENLFKKKIAEGLITRTLLEESVKQHADGLLEYFGVITSLADNFLRSSQQYAIVARAASTLYSSAFEVFDPSYQQEVVGSLVTHIGKIDVALSVLLQLAQQFPVKLSRFVIFIKGVLDYIDNLSLDQIRILFDIFGILAYEVTFDDHEFL